MVRPPSDLGAWVRVVKLYSAKDLGQATSEARRRSSRQEAQRRDWARPGAGMAWALCADQRDMTAAFAAFQKTARARLRKSAPLGLHVVCAVDPEWIAQWGNPHDAGNAGNRALFDLAVSWVNGWARSDLVAAPVWAARLDLDEVGAARVDVFVSPVFASRAWPVVSSQKALARLKVAHKRPTEYAALQVSWAACCQSHDWPALPALASALQERVSPKWRGGAGFDSQTLPEALRAPQGGPDGRNAYDGMVSRNTGAGTASVAAGAGDGMQPDHKEAKQPPAPRLGIRAALRDLDLDQTMPAAETRARYELLQAFAQAADLLPEMARCRRNPAVWRPAVVYPEHYGDMRKDVVSGGPWRQEVWFDMLCAGARRICRRLEQIGLPSHADGFAPGAAVPRSLLRWFPDRKDVATLAIMEVHAALDVIEQRVLIEMPGYVGRDDLRGIEVQERCDRRLSEDSAYLKLFRLSAAWQEDLSRPGSM